MTRRSHRTWTQKDSRYEVLQYWNDMAPSNNGARTLTLRHPPAPTVEGPKSGAQQRLQIGLGIDLTRIEAWQEGN
jgi:hypothetical protein